MTQINKLLASAEIPVLNPSTYYKYQEEIAPVPEKAAKDSCRRAALEERKLVIQKMNELQKYL